MSLMYAAKRTYPEALPAATAAASRFGRATEEDLEKLLQAISYLGHDPDHCLVIHPGSLSVVCSADASYASHPDARSHTGVCVGFKGCDDVPDSYFIFVSGKQPIVTTSTTEAELVAGNVGAEYVVWEVELLVGFDVKAGAAVMCRCADRSDYAYIEVPVVYQDNKSTIHLIEHGRGNFRNTKHIRVRYYYIHELVMSGELKVVWLSTKEMVADILSKGVVWGVFEYLLPKLIGKR
jgi:hypothetical protein